MIRNSQIVPANHPDIWWTFLLTCCHLHHVSHDTHSPRLAFKLVSHNCAWHTSLLTGCKHKSGILCGRLGCVSFSPLNSGRWRELLVPWSFWFLLTVPKSPNMLKFPKRVSKCPMLLSATESNKVLLSPGYTCFSAGTACLWLSIN